MGFNNAQEALFKEANILVSDAVINHQTVASFGNEQLLVDKFKSLLKGPLEKGIAKAHYTGITYGFSQFIQFATYTILFWSAGAFMRADPFGLTGKDVFTSIFVIMFGAFAAGQAQQFGPSAGKGLKAANRIFCIID